MAIDLKSKKNLKQADYFITCKMIYKFVLTFKKSFDQFLLTGMNHLKINWKKILLMNRFFFYNFKSVFELAS